MMGLDNFALPSPSVPWQPTTSMTYKNPSQDVAATFKKLGLNKVAEEWLPVYLMACMEDRGGYTVLVNIKMRFKKVVGGVSGTVGGSDEFDEEIYAKPPNLGTQTCTPQVYGDSNFISNMEIHTTYRGVEFIKIINT